MAHHPLSWHLAQDENQLAQRRSMNDQLDRPREIDQFAYFRKSQDAEKVAGLLREAGYRVDVSRKLLSTGLAAHKMTPVDATSVSAFVTQMYELVESNRGEYDGWGAPVVTG